MNVYPNGRARVTAESLQIHHKPCDVFENSTNQEGTIGKGTEYTLIRHKSATYTPKDS
jgi:hypothetical protein